MGGAYIALYLSAEWRSLPFCGVCDAPQGHITAAAPHPCLIVRRVPSGNRRLPQIGVCASHPCNLNAGGAASSADLLSKVRGSFRGRRDELRSALSCFRSTTPLPACPVFNRQVQNASELACIVRDEGSVPDCGHEQQ